MIIRHADKNDIKKLAIIEEASYPPSEGASEAGIMARINVFPECFWILEDQGEIKAFVNGMVTNETNLNDKMYDDAFLHQLNGDWQMIFSVVTAPKYRGMGYAGKLLKQMLEDSRKRGKKGVVLTCKEYLIDFYAQYGFVNEGISCSTHGDVIWYQMRMSF